MITINIIDSASGLLKRSVTCEDEQAEEQVHAGESIVDTPVPDALPGPVQWSGTAWQTGSQPVDVPLGTLDDVSSWSR